MPELPGAAPTSVEMEGPGLAALPGATPQIDIEEHTALQRTPRATAPAPSGAAPSTMPPAPVPGGGESRFTKENLIYFVLGSLANIGDIRAGRAPTTGTRLIQEAKAGERAAQDAQAAQYLAQLSLAAAEQPQQALQQINSFLTAWQGKLSPKTTEFALNVAQDIQRKVGVSAALKQLPKDDKDPRAAFIRRWADASRGQITPEALQDVVKVASLIQDPETKMVETPTRIYAFDRQGNMVGSHPVEQKPDVMTTDKLVTALQHPEGLAYQAWLAGSNIGEAVDLQVKVATGVAKPEEIIKFNRLRETVQANLSATKVGKVTFGQAMDAALGRLSKPSTPESVHRLLRSSNEEERGQGSQMLHDAHQIVEADTRQAKLAQTRAEVQVATEKYTTSTLGQFQQETLAGKGRIVHYRDVLSKDVREWNELPSSMRMAQVDKRVDAGTVRMLDSKTNEQVSHLQSGIDNLVDAKAKGMAVLKTNSSLQNAFAAGKAKLLELIGKADPKVLADLRKFQTLTGDAFAAARARGSDARISDKDAERVDIIFGNVSYFQSRAAFEAGVERTMDIYENNMRRMMGLPTILERHEWIQRKSSEGRSFRRLSK
mgnify:FL=1